MAKRGFTRSAPPEDSVANTAFTLSIKKIIKKNSRSKPQNVPFRPKERKAGTNAKKKTARMLSMRAA